MFFLFWICPAAINSGDSDIKSSPDVKSPQMLGLSLDAFHELGLAEHQASYVADKKASDILIQTQKQNAAAAHTTTKQSKK